MTPFSRSSFIPKSIALNPECKNDPVVLGLKDINNNMRKIDAYVVLGLKGKRKQLEDQRKRDTNTKRKERKLGLEKQRKVNPINFIKEKLPRTGFLDAIRNFILYTAMGMAVPFALKNLPKILGIVKFIIPFYKVFEDFMGNVLGGIVSAVDFGYKVHDKIRGILKKVTGDKFEKSFDDLEKNLNTFLNLAVVLGLAVAGSGGIPMPKGPKGGTVPAGTPPAKKILPSGSLSRVNDSYARFIAGDANIGDRARLARRGYIDAQDTLTKGGSNALAKRAARKAAPKTGGKFIGKFARVFGRVPVVGGLIDFALSMMMGEKPGRAAAKAIGATIGAGLGSFIPVPGVGTILGGIIGDIVGGALYDTLSGFGKPQKHATGGRVGSKSYSRIPRTIKKAKAKRPPKQLRQRTMPGKNVGGEDNIKKLFPDSDDDKMMSPLRLLKKNAGVMKKAGVFGNLLSSGVEMMALGQKIERPTLMGLEKYLAFVIDSSIDDQSATNAKMLGSSMFAMASGGIVPASRTISQSGTSPGQVVAKEIVRSFTAMLDNRSSEIFQNIRKELELKSPEGSAPASEGGEGGGLQVTSSSPDFWLLATAALFEGISLQGYADVAQAIYNRVAMPGDPWKVNGSIRTAILNPKQFAPVGENGGAGVWGQIKDKESAIAFIKSKGKTQEQLEAAAAALLDTSRQRSARTFVGPRDSFRSYNFENANNHIADDTEVRREGHAFGFEPRGSTIASFRAGSLKPAAVSSEIKGTVEEGPPGFAGNISGPITTVPGILDQHGRPVQFAKPAAEAFSEMMIVAKSQGKPFIGSDITSTYRTPQYNAKINGAAGSLHTKGLAIDVHGTTGQWIRRNGRSYGWVPHDYKGTHGGHYEFIGRIGPTRASQTKRDLTSPIIPNSGVGSRPSFNPAISKPLKPHSPIVSVVSSFSVYENGKKAVYTRKRVNNNDVYTRNGKPITEDEYWRVSDKKNSISSNQMGENRNRLNIASSPQQQRLQQISNIASRITTNIEKETQILIQPIVA
jgi:hypothetical protein